MNPYMDRLQPYPFEKLAKLKSEVTPPADKHHIALSIGEPKHEAPAFVVEKLKNALPTITNYPLTKGTDSLRASIATWATQRFQLKENSLTAESHVIPVNGTREALFAFTQVVVDGQSKKNTVLMPNPFYQIYEGAALLAGAQPAFVNCDKNSAYCPNFDSVTEETWQQCQLLFICTPGNPTGAVLDLDTLKKLIALADKYDFVIASDECYSELYFDEDTPPPGLLQACAELGRNDFSRCVVFHSLSKRSNLPGLRSGFVAGDQALLQRFLQYRTYHGCAMPLFSQEASIAAWSDETHVKHNRNMYREKFDQVLNILDGTLDVKKPDASFYLWPELPISDTEFAQKLYGEENITVLPGSFLARDTQAGNPGNNHVRMALVAPLEECVEAANRIKQFVQRIRS